MEVKGIGLDAKTRCHHYHTRKDIVAIRFYCCKEYYACIKCHEETADHDVEVWPAALQSEKAILCGNCHEELSIKTYRSSVQCPSCGHEFNPGCQLHDHYYFE
ncbi:CHY zinc finger protein [Salimicrobium halophilum]|uniref:CHY zinc finger protein n=1 Tax=Salimicrobium halophilum TaxID=86666 RepID=UPI000B86648D|nr:CHY zinc finger protein [Salimicrobium halophilum]